MSGRVGAFSVRMHGEQETVELRYSKVSMFVKLLVTRRLKTTSTSTTGFSLEIFYKTNYDFATSEVSCTTSFPSTVLYRQKSLMCVSPCM